MSRQREYLNCTKLNLDSATINILGLKNTNPNSDITSYEVVDFVARLFLLSSKRGRKSEGDIGGFNEAI